jgi:AcrR family transcriptional regulator
MAVSRRESVSLEEERRELVRDRIVRAALTGLSDIGVDVRVEDIAEIAGVGRRTIFRYFPTRDDLLGEALESAIKKYLDHIPRRDGRDVWTWLPEVAAASTEVNATYGLGYWQLVLQTNVEGPFGEALAARRTRRQRWSREIALEAWQGAGGQGTPPQWMIDAFLLVLGPFTTAGLQIDGQLDLATTQDTAALLLRALLEKALSSQASGKRSDAVRKAR